MKIHATAASSVIAIVLASGTVHAQEANDRAAPPAGDSSATQLEDIVVTAQRREERLQDVPISVTAITSSMLSKSGITDVVTLSTMVPGLVATIPSPAPLIFLRGVGSNAANPNDEASVATYVDGIYMASPFANVMSFNNIERIEVLKGPQGTLFGRNATGGVIQIITKDPGRERTMEAKVGYGNYERVTTSLYASTPLSDTLAADIAVQYENQGRGYGRNVTLDREIRKGRSFGVRSKFLFEPSNATSIRLSLDYAESSNSYADFRLPPGVLGVNGLPTAQGFDTSTNVPNSIKSDQRGVGLKIDQDLGFAQLTSLTGYRKSRGIYEFEPDATALNVLDGYLVQDQHNISQELQLTAPSSSKVKWVIGAFYYNNYAAYSRSVLAGLAFAPAPFIDPYGIQRTKSYSAYGQGSATILPATELTLGVRYTHEKQTFNGGIPAFALVAPEQKQGFDKLTWRAALDHHFTDNVHAYVSYNRGVKSGGFDLLSPGSAGYRPEVLDSYEAGLKSELFDRRVRANIAAFYYDYQDIQVQSIVLSTVLTTNAAKARIKGIDFDVQVVPIRNMTITGALQVMDGKYIDFPNAIFYPSSPFNNPPTVIDVSGRKTVRTPKYTWNVGANYNIESSVGTFNISGVLAYNDGFYFAPDNNFEQKSYYLANGSLGWTSNDEHVGLNFWVKNLFDKRYLATGVPGSFGDLSVPAAPRTYGLTGSVKF